MRERKGSPVETGGGVELHLIMSIGRRAGFLGPMEDKAIVRSPITVQGRRYNRTLWFSHLLEPLRGSVAQ